MRDPSSEDPQRPLSEAVRDRVRAEVLAVVSSGSRSRQIWRGPLAAAAAVAALAAGAVLLPLHGSDPRVSEGGATASASAPAGWQTVSSLGLEVDAPGDWPINSWSGCDAAPAALITRGLNAEAGCGNDAVVPSTLTIEQMPVHDAQGAGSFGRPPATPGGPETEQSLDLGGAPATVVTVPLSDGRTRSTLTVPQRQVRLVVTTPTLGLTSAIVRTARVVDADGLGCSTAPPPSDWDVRRPGPAVDLAGPAMPVSVAVCSYVSAGPVWTTSTPSAPIQPTSYVLSASALLTGAAMTTAVDAIDRAAAGPVPDAPADQCMPDLPETMRVWLHVNYPDRPTVDVVVHYTTCEDRWTATEEGISSVTMAQLSAVLNPLHIGGYGVMGPIPER